jgi:hypothetical protein
MARKVSAAAKRTRNIQFTVGRVIKRNRLQMAKGGRIIAKKMTKQLKDLVSVDGPPRSSPGQPPRRDSDTYHGKLKAVWERGAIVIKTTQVGIYLEGGTSRMAARPHIRPTIHNKRRQWEREFNATLRRLDKT